MSVYEVYLEVGGVLAAREEAVRPPRPPCELAGKVHSELYGRGGVAGVAQCGVRHGQGTPHALALGAHEVHH
eukprot:7816049-Pyramimonas_sp.AAC.1